MDDFAVVRHSNHKKHGSWVQRAWGWVARLFFSGGGKTPPPLNDKDSRKQQPPTQRAAPAQHAPKAHSSATSAEKAKERLQQMTRGASQQTLHEIRLQIQNANEANRLMIVDTLEEIGTEEAFDLLAQMLPDRSARVQQTLLSILTRTEPRALRAMQRLLTHPSPAHQRAALEIIKMKPWRYGEALCAYIHAALMNLIPTPDDVAAEVAALLEQIATDEAQIAVARWRAAHPQPGTHSVGETVEAEPAAHPQPGTHSVGETVEAEPAAEAQPAAAPMLALVLLDQPRPDLVNYPQAVAALLQHIRTGQWGDQQEAVNALHRLAADLQDAAPYEVMALLMDALDDTNAMVRWAGAEALGRMRAQAAVERLGQRVSDPVWTVQVAAIRALMEIGDTAALYWVEPALDEPNAGVQEAAVEALGCLGSARHVERLKAIMLSGRDPMVRIAAVEAARGLRAAGVSEALTALLDEPLLMLRWAAARALSELADISAVPALRAHLHDTGQPAWEERRVCDFIQAALERIQASKRA